MLPHHGAMVDVGRFATEHAEGVAALARAEGWPTFSDVDRVRGLFTAPGAQGYVAVQDGLVVGAAHLLTDGHHGYLTFLAVAADRRRAGIGRLLVSAAFRESGAERIDLLSTVDSKSFYESMPHSSFLGFRLYPDAD
jgi:ribosomal protein S18 acetylase RimI-like enzyme